MIDLGSGRLVALADVPDHLPAKRGRKVHLATVHRWATRGVSGIRLETLRIGGAKFTSAEALQAFCERLSTGGDGAALAPHLPNPGVRSIAQRQRDSERAARVLEAAGA